MKIISISNQKGGVGKTTTTINLAAALAALKRRILVIDLDPQGNTSSGCGIDKYSFAFGSNEVLLGEANIHAAITSPANVAFDVLPADASLTHAELRLVNEPERQLRLKTAISNLTAEYDLILIDCPPSFSMLTVNALVAAQSVIIPVQCEYYSLEGLTGLLELIEEVKEAYNPTLIVDAIVRTMYDPRSRLSRDVSNQLFEHYSDKLLQSTIARNVRLAEAPSYGRSVVDYDINSRGAISYMAMANELIRKGLA